MRIISKNAFRNAFTLAEVLITLAIIGVVAAMTMPTLINNTNSAQFKTAYKKALSVLNQAVVMNIALYDYDLAGTAKCEGADCGDTKDANGDVVKGTSSLYNMFASRTNYAGKVGDASDYVIDLTSTGDLDSDIATAIGSKTAADFIVWSALDNTGFAYLKDAAACTETAPCFGFIDANGVKGPNKLSTCTSTKDPDAEVAEGTVETYECTNSATINDIFPVRFYDQTIAPASASARAVLYGNETKQATAEEDE